MAEDQEKADKKNDDPNEEEQGEENVEQPKENKEKKGKKGKKGKKKQSSESEEESEPESSEDDGKKKKKDRNKRKSKDGKGRKEESDDESSEDDSKKKKKGRSKKKTKEGKNKKGDSEFRLIYEGLENESWEQYDSPPGCLQIPQLKSEINSRVINEPAIYDRDGKYYRWARLGEKGYQQLLIGPLYFLSMGELSTEQYGESYFYCAVPKEHFIQVENALNKQLNKAEKKFKAKGHTPFVKKEVTCRLPALERFRMGLIDVPEDWEEEESQLTAANCTLVQFPLSVSDPSRFTVTLGEEDLMLRDVFERLPGVIGYANVTVLFSAEVPAYADDQSGDSDDDGKKRKGGGSSSKKKSKSHKSKQQDPMDPGASCLKVSVKFKVSSISIVGQTIAKAVPMSESTAIENVKPSTGLLSAMRKRQ